MWSHLQPWVMRQRRRQALLCGDDFAAEEGSVLTFGTPLSREECIDGSIMHAPDVSELYPTLAEIEAKIDMAFGLLLEIVETLRRMERTSAQKEGR